MTTPAGTTTYSYDSTSGRLSKIAGPGNKSFDFTYDKGDLKTLSMPNGITSQFTYDQNGNLTNLAYMHGTTSVRAFGYTDNQNSQRTVMTDNDGKHHFTYDNADQLIAATHPRIQDPLENFKYDAAGNRLYGLASSTTWSYNELNQLTEDDSSSYAYDKDGNMILKANKFGSDTTVYTYDIENKLIAAVNTESSLQFSYDAQGRRVSKVVNGVAHEFRYDGDNLVLETNNKDSTLASYTFGPGIDWPIAMERGGKSYYYLRDGSGSVTQITDENAAIVKEYKYGVYGNIVAELGTLENSFMYTSREWDKELGYYYFRARYYDPRNGRWLERDPIGILGGINLYVYSWNDPINLNDPSGDLGIPGAVAGGIAGTIGGAIGATVNGGNWISIAKGAVTGGVIGAAIGLVTPESVKGAIGSAMVGSAIGSGFAEGHVNWAGVGGAAVGAAIGMGNAAYAEGIGGLAGNAVQGVMDGLLGGGTEAAVGKAFGGHKESGENTSDPCGK